MLGDLRSDCPPDVKSPVVEALGAGREVVAIVGQDRLLEGGVLSGRLGW